MRHRRFGAPAGPRGPLSGRALSGEVAGARRSARRSQRVANAPYCCARAGALTGASVSSGASSMTVTPGPICWSDRTPRSFSATPS